jgi:hypothetical protein
VLICSERRLLEHSNWLTRQIFKEKINIREEKLLLYHCLLELGLPKVKVSEHGLIQHFSSIKIRMRLRIGTPTKAGATKPGGTKPGVTKTGVTKTGATKPGATRPGKKATEPGK